MDLVAGAMGSLAWKLGKLLKKEYDLPKGVRDDVEFLSRELENARAVLRMVAKVPPDQQREPVRIWARDVREASYVMEDILDTYLVRVAGAPNKPPDPTKIRNLMRNMCKVFSKRKSRGDIACAIQDIKKKLQEAKSRHDMWKLDDIVTNTAAASLNPRISVLSKNQNHVGIDDSMNVLISKLWLQKGPDDYDDESWKKLRTVCVLGSGGLGKTTLAKAVYDKLITTVEFGCAAFVSVGQNPDPKKVLRDILIHLDKQIIANSNLVILDENMLIGKLQDFLKGKRYFIVIDDIWDTESWKIISLALYDNELGSRIITTTRINDVSKQAQDSYKLEPLPSKSSETLFFQRLFGPMDKCRPELFGVSNDILKKCGGVPLAIITISSLLASKPQNLSEWQEVCDSIGSGIESDNDNINDMRKILSLSYYHLPPHLKTCLLYLSIFPEDCEIRADRLILMWIAEDFVNLEAKPGGDLFETGKSYFNELLNRGLIMQADLDVEGMPQACRVHDMVLDLIRSLSREEDFTSFISYDDIQQTSFLENKFRRFSLQCNNQSTTSDMSRMCSLFSSPKKLRTLSMFYGVIDDLTPYLSFCQLLRVLDLESCHFKNWNNHPSSILRCIGNLCHLRYLGLRDTFYGGELPLENLEFLMILDLRGTSLRDIPSSVVSLSQLMCLYIENDARLPRNLRNLAASLQVLEVALVDQHTASYIVEELGYLVNLQKLYVSINLGQDGTLECHGKALLESLRKLQKMKVLRISGFGRGAEMMREASSWMPSPVLRHFSLRYSDEFDEDSGDCYSDVHGLFSTLPTWITPSFLGNLSRLYIAMTTVCLEDIQTIGTLPALVFLWLQGECPNYEICTPVFKEGRKCQVSGKLFPCAKTCKFTDIVVVPSMFPLGAMPFVERLEFDLQAVDFKNRRLDMEDLHIKHLPSLRSIFVMIHEEYGYGGKSEDTFKIEKALTHYADVHRNKPDVDFGYIECF